MSQSELNLSLLYSALSSEVFLKAPAGSDSAHSTSATDSLWAELSLWLYPTQPSWGWETWAFAQGVYHSNHVACCIFIAFTDQPNEPSYFKTKLF